MSNGFRSLPLGKEEIELPLAARCPLLGGRSLPPIDWQIERGERTVLRATESVQIRFACKKAESVEKAKGENREEEKERDPRANAHPIVASMLRKKASLIFKAYIINALFSKKTPRRSAHTPHDKRELYFYFFYFFIFLFSSTGRDTELHFFLTRNGR